MPKRYPEEFRPKVLDFVAAGRPVAQIANDLQINDQTIYNWRRQEIIDTGQLPGLNRAELSELSAANKRIRDLETEVAILKRPASCSGSRTTQKGGTRHSHHGHRRTPRAKGVSTARGRRLGLLSMALPTAPSARAVRHAWLTDQVQAVHNRLTRHLRCPPGAC